MTDATHTWWSLLCGVSAFNVFVWVTSTLRLHLRSGVLRLRAWSTEHWHVLLSAGYVLGCGYRCVFPVYDVQRLVMVDSWLSSVAIGRSVATVAELCLAAQCALLLNSVAKASGCAPALRVSHWIVPMIGVAEVFSWSAVLTTSNLGHVLEETLWGFSAMLIVGSFVMVWPRAGRSHRAFLALCIVLGTAYVIYMFKVDVPMYWARWVDDEARGHQYLSIAQGLVDVSSRWAVSHRWTDWESEVVWMSLYFSVAVWFSISLMHVAHTLSAKPNAIRLHDDSARTAADHVSLKSSLSS